MANGKITLGKQSGGTLGLVFPDGISNTEVVLPESGELATKDSPAFTGTPTAPTPAHGEYGNRIATTEFVLNSSNSENVYQGPYGISWNYATDTYIRTGAKGYTAIQSMMRRCVLNVDGSVKYYLHPDNSNFKEDGTPRLS